MEKCATCGVRFSWAKVERHRRNPWHVVLTVVTAVFWFG